MTINYFIKKQKSFLISFLKSSQRTYFQRKSPIFEKPRPFFDIISFKKNPDRIVCVLPGLQRPLRLFKQNNNI